MQLGRFIPILATGIVATLALSAGPADAASTTDSTHATAGTLARASGKSPGPTAQAASAGRHCVVALGAQGAKSCFRSFPEAIGYATGGKVLDAPADPKAALPDAGFAAKLDKIGADKAAAPVQSLASDIVISIEYSDDNYHGYTLTYTGTHACDDYTDQVEFSVFLIDNGGWWNDEIESFRSYANCAAMHFLHLGASVSYGPGDNGYYYYRSVFPGWLSDEISSIAWT